MPGFDGTGPLGMGARTGRGMGFCWPGGVSPFGSCAPYGVGRGSLPRGGGRGHTWGGGRGLGWRTRAYCHPGYARAYPPSYSYPPMTPEQERTIIQDDIKALEEGLSELRTRLNELKQQKASEQKSGEK